MLIATPLAHNAPFAPCPIRDVQTPVLFNRFCAGKFGVCRHLQGLDLVVVLLLDVYLIFASSLQRCQQVVDTVHPVTGAGANGGIGVFGCGTYGSIA